MGTSAPSDPVQFHYRFEFGNGSTKEFDIKLDPQTLGLIDRATLVRPEWTKLDYDRCVNCPLTGKVEYCPVAVNLAQIVESFKDSISHERALVTITTKERTYQQETSVQKGLSSIIGIYNVTSNCPILDRLRPMVRFHLPFASGDETMYRAVSMYLTAQYFVMQRGGKPDWRLEDLAKIYEALSQVEQGLSARLRHASRDDANVNAVIILSSFGQQVRFQIEDGLRDIEPWFATYLEKTAGEHDS